MAKPINNKGRYLIKLCLIDVSIHNDNLPPFRLNLKFFRKNFEFELKYLSANFGLLIVLGS